MVTLRTLGFKGFFLYFFILLCRKSTKLFVFIVFSKNTTYNKSKSNNSTKIREDF